MSNKLRKGSLVSTQTAIVLIMIISIVIVIGYYSLVFGKSTSTIADTACRNSVDQRHIFNLGTFEPGKNIIPLKCETQKTCFTSSDYLCFDELGISSTEDPIKFVKVSDDKESVKQKILDRIAESLIKCHTNLGAGQKDFMPNREWPDNYCIICSQIALDDKSYEAVKDVGYSEFYNYLYNKKTSKGKTYLEAIYGVKNPEIGDLVFNGIVGSSELNERIRESLGGKTFNDLKIVGGKDNVIIAQIQSHGRLKQYALTLGVAGAGLILTAAAAIAPFTGGISLAGGLSAVGFFFSGITVTTIGGGISTTTLAAAITYATITPAGNVYFSPVIIPHQSEYLKNVKCDRFEELP